MPNRLAMIQAIIETKGLIALAAAALTFQTQVQLGLEPHWHPYVAVVFFATMLEYNLHRLFSIRSHPGALETEKHRWVRDHRTTFYVTMSLSATGLGVSILFLPLKILYILVPLGLVTVLYSAPIKRATCMPIKIRHLPYVKIFAISAVWALATTMLPLIQSNMYWTWQTLGGLFTERFLFVFALTLPFDARDIHTDMQDGLTTIPSRIGVEKAHQLAIFIVVVFMAWCIVKYGLIGSMHLVVAFLISGLITIAVMTSQRIMSLPHYYYGILDGMMLLQGVIVLASTFVF